jgi:lysosomal acid lipase/cholesteryl ester hydrolase
MEMFKTGNHTNFGKKVMLMHEFAGSADSAFYNGNQSMGFHMVNQGYDVWLPNNRGNKYSSENLREGMSAEKFYDYSFAEMGKYDIPALYKYILEEYNSGIFRDQKITFIGYSQGTSQMFSGLLEEGTGEWLAERTEKYIAMAPVTYLNHAESWVYMSIAKVLIGQRIFAFKNKIFGSYQALPTFCRHNFALASLATSFCSGSWIGKKICQNVIPGVSIDPRIDNILENFKKLSEYYPSGSSAKSLIHLAQLMIVDKNEYSFSRFDYGAAGNLERYGTEATPRYDLTKIHTKTVIINGTEDYLANRTDVEKLNED